MNEGSLPNQDSAFSSTFLCLILHLNGSTHRRKKRDGAEQLWLCNSWAQHYRETQCWGTILCPFLIWAPLSFPLAAEGNDSLHTSAWTEALCTHTMSQQQSKTKPVALCSDRNHRGTPPCNSPSQCRGGVLCWAHLGHTVHSPVRHPWTSSKWIKASPSI